MQTFAEEFYVNEKAFALVTQILFPVMVLRHEILSFQ